METFATAQFCDEHRELFSYALPLRAEKYIPCPDWRGWTKDEVQAALNRPLVGVLEHVMATGLWFTAWGEEP